jgi:hypothetical protein
MEPVGARAIFGLRALIDLSVMEEERLRVILDDDAVDTKEREEALEKLVRVFQNHRTQLEQLAVFESRQ